MSRARVSAADFAAAVEAAEVAIRAGQTRPRIHLGSPRPEAVIAPLEARLRAGEPISADEAQRLAEALAQGRLRRPRGRPRGAGAATEEQAAAWRALRALRGSLLRTYRNESAPPRSRCDAVAAAMRRCGYRRVNTYGAVAEIARCERRVMRRSARIGAAAKRLFACLDRSARIGAAAKRLFARLDRVEGISPQAVPAEKTSTDQ